MSFEKPWGNYLLENIVETTAPESISYFPDTIGWQFLLVLTVGVMIKKSWQTWQAYKNNAYRREALAWLTQTELIRGITSPASITVYNAVSNEKYLRQLPALLKKTAAMAIKTSTLKTTNINKLSGDEWAKWLDFHCSKTQFSNKNNIDLLMELPYKRSIAVDDQHITEFIRQVTLWITHHHVTEVTS